MIELLVVQGEAPFRADGVQVEAELSGTAADRATAWESAQPEAAGPYGGA